MTRASFLLLLLALALAAACGGSSTSTPPPEVVQGEPQPEAVAPPPQARSPWADMDAGRLATFVDERARARLREVQPDFDPDRLDAYRADPTSAPEISGRAVERLFDIAMADLVAGRADAAEATIRLVRARAKNRNSAFAGTTLL